MIDIDSMLKKQSPELGDNPIDTIEEMYRKEYEFKKDKSSEFDAEHFEELKTALLLYKIFPYVYKVYDKVANRENLGKVASGADLLNIEAKSKVTSSEIYMYLKSLDKDSVRSIIGGVTDDQEEYDALSDAMELDDKAAFITIVRKYNNLKLHNLCAIKLAMQNDTVGINKIMTSDDSYEDINSGIEEYHEKLKRNSNGLEVLYQDADADTIVKLILQMADSVMSIRERKEMKQFFEDPVVNSIFDGGKYISDSRPNEKIPKFMKEAPVAVENLCRLSGLDASELLDEQSRKTRVVSTKSGFRSMLIGSDDERDAIIAKLTKYIDDKGEVLGAELAQLIFASSEMGWLCLPNKNIKDYHKAMKNTFGDRLGTYEFFNTKQKAVRDLDNYLKTPNAELLDKAKFDDAKMCRDSINDIKRQLKNI